MGLTAVVKIPSTAVVKIPSSSADFTLHHRDAALKTHENGKIDGC